MNATLMALYRTPEGGPEALETFRRRYLAEHLPLVRQTPGLRSLHVARVSEAWGRSDLCMVARMIFDDRAALDAGLASEAMRAAGRILREIAPGLATVIVVEPDDEMEPDPEPGPDLEPAA
ncbi:MAG: EthD family reductase [Candidatus Limnocylindrales bacterium]